MSVADQGIQFIGENIPEGFTLDGQQKRWGYSANLIKEGVSFAEIVFNGTFRRFDVFLKTTAEGFENNIEKIQTFVGGLFESINSKVQINREAFRAFSEKNDQLSNSKAKEEDEKTEPVVLDTTVGMFSVHLPRLEKGLQATFLPEALTTIGNKNVFPSSVRDQEEIHTIAFDSKACEVLADRESANVDPGVTAAILSQEGNLLVIERGNRRLAFPGGVFGPNDGLRRNAALREAKEEAGVSLSEESYLGDSATLYFNVNRPKDRLAINTVSCFQGGSDEVWHLTENAKQEGIRNIYKVSLDSIVGHDDFINFMNGRRSSIYDVKIYINQEGKVVTENLDKKEHENRGHNKLGPEIIAAALSFYKNSFQKEELDDSKGISYMPPRRLESIPLPSSPRPVKSTFSISQIAMKVSLAVFVFLGGFFLGKGKMPSIGFKG